MYYVRVMWESSLKFCQNIPGENVVTRNLMRNFTKLVDNKFSLSQLQGSTIFIPVALIYTYQLSYWAIPVDASLHAFCAVPVHDCCTLHTAHCRSARRGCAVHCSVSYITRNKFQQSPWINSDTHNWQKMRKCVSMFVSQKYPHSLRGLFGQSAGRGALEFLRYHTITLTHCGRVTQICVFNTVKLGTSASSP